MSINSNGYYSIKIYNDNKTNSMWNKILSKGKNILVIREVTDKLIDNKFYEYIIDIDKEDISGIKIDISMNDISNNSYDINHSIFYKEEENEPEPIICNNACACTSRTKNKCTVSKELNLVNENTISRAQRIHQRRIGGRKGMIMFSNYKINKYGAREGGSINSNSDCDKNNGGCNNNRKPNNF